MKKILFLAALLGTAASAMAQETVTKMVVEDVDGNVTKIETEKVKQITFVEEERLVVPTTVDEALEMLGGQWYITSPRSGFPLPVFDKLYRDFRSDRVVTFYHVKADCTDPIYGPLADQYVKWIETPDKAVSDCFSPDATDPTKGTCSFTEDGYEYRNLTYSSYEIYQDHGTWASVERVSPAVTYVDKPVYGTGSVTIDGTDYTIRRVTVEYNWVYDGYYLSFYDDVDHQLLSVDLAGEFADGDTHQLLDIPGTAKYSTWLGVYISSKSRHSWYQVSNGDVKSGSISVAIDAETGEVKLTLSDAVVHDSSVDIDISCSASYEGKFTDVSSVAPPEWSGAGSVTCNGTTSAVDAVYLYFYPDVNAYAISFYDSDRNFVGEVDMPAKFLGQTLDLTTLWEDSSWTLGLYDNTDSWYESGSDFKSGTCFMEVDDEGNTKVEVTSVLNSDEDFNISFEGKVRLDVGSMIMAKARNGAFGAKQRK